MWAPAEGVGLESLTLAYRGEDVFADGVVIGLSDVISATPFTNTLVIRRTSLKPGDSLDLSVAYLSVPAMQFEAKRQRYTCLEVNGQGARYRFEDLSSKFRADIQFDSNGLVTDYSGLFHSVWRL
jgi:hypothetical protein